MGRTAGGSSAPLKFQTSTNILDLLGVQLYSSVPKAISELVKSHESERANEVF